MTTTKTKPSPSPDPDTIFAELLQDLPPETAELARQFNAFARARKIKTPEQLLRVVLLFAALDYSEREIAANLVLTSPAINKLSNQAVRDRLAACLPWLQALLPKLIERPALPGLPSGLRLLALDASEIGAPGGKGAWRLHALMEVVSLQLVAVELTDLKTGETLCNFEFAAGDVVLTDRGYSHRRGVSHLLKSGGEIVTRYNPHHIPLTCAQGQALDVAEWLADCERGERRTLEGFFTAPDGTRHQVWVHACRLPEQDAAAARRRCLRAGKTGKYTPRKQTLFLAEFVMVLTSVAPKVLSAEVVLELYRCRWQIEICQTQPIKIAWCPLRLFHRAVGDLRGGFKRENEMDVDFSSRDDDFFDQALSNGLTLFKREPVEILAKQCAKGLGIFNHLLPVNGLLLSAG